METRLKNSSPWWFVTLMLLVLIWANMGLFTFWFSDPLGQYAFAAFLIWLIGFKGVALSMTLPRRRVRWWMLVVVLLITGMLLNIQFLNQTALIGSLAGRYKTKTARLCCYIAALGWTPFFGWAGQQFTTADLSFIRILWVLVLLSITYLKGFLDKK